MNRFLALGATAACSVSSLALARSCWNLPAVANQKICASERYARADKELNAVWPVAQAYLKYVDSDASNGHTPLPASLTPAAQLLTIAQRAWISHRDLDCAAAAASSSGANNRDVWKLECRADKTYARAAELRTIHADGTFLYMPEEIQAPFDEIKWTLAECEDQDSTRGWTRCVTAIHKVVDRDLNTRYYVVKSELARYPGAVDSLVSSERAWIKIRDNDCEAVTRESYGVTGNKADLTVCHIRKTIERTHELLGRFPPVIE